MEPERKTISELYLKLANYLVKYEKNDSKALNYLDRLKIIIIELWSIIRMISKSINLWYRYISKLKIIKNVKPNANKFFIYYKLNKINPRNEYASLIMSELLIINNQG